MAYNLEGYKIWDDPFEMTNTGKKHGDYDVYQINFDDDPDIYYIEFSRDNEQTTGKLTLPTDDFNCYDNNTKA